MHRANEELQGVMAAWNRQTAVRPFLFVEAQAEFSQHLTSQFYHTASLAVNRLMEDREHRDLQTATGLSSGKATSATIKPFQVTLKGKTDMLLDRESMERLQRGELLIDNKNPYEGVHHSHEQGLLK